VQNVLPPTLTELLRLCQHSQQKARRHCKSPSRRHLEFFSKITFYAKIFSQPSAGYVSG